MLDESLWRATALPSRGPSRPIPNEVDVVVVGAGITGLTAAYLLKRSGKRVAVFERETIGSGDTGNTSAHVTYVTDAWLGDLVKQFGRDAARRVWEAGRVAIDLIESNASEPGIACGFRRVPGYRCSPFLEEGHETDRLREEAALAAELGFAVRFLENGPITGRPAVEFADQAVFHPLEYLAGLASAIEGGGSSVHEHAEVSEVREDPLAVVVNGQIVACDDVVIATHVPLMGATGLLSATLFQTKLYPYSSYVLGSRLTDESIMPGLYSDTADPYYYLRVHRDARGLYAIFGGADHKTGQESRTPERFQEIDRAFARLFPQAKIERHWSGQVIETVDGLPYVGETAPHQFAATGYAGNGMTFGTISGLMMHDGVMGHSNPWREIFDVNRKASAVNSISTFLSENADYPFYYIADRLRNRDADSTRGVPRGGGKVLKLNGKRVAVHRTASGELKKVSAVCTHMGCLVRWNGADATWDCPCHGSRFTPDGLVLGGPAETALEKIDD